MSNTLELAILHADACGFSAAMAASEETAIARLKAGQSLFRQSASQFGGRVVDTAGDSALLTFETVRAAFAAARHINEQIRLATLSEADNTPFDYRIGLTRGRVKIDGSAVFGQCVNMAARIEALVSRGGIGIERSIWHEVQSLAHGASIRPRVLFAKPEEQAIDFLEISHSTPASEANVAPFNPRNEPLVLIIPQFHDLGNRSRNDAIEAVIWDCIAFFAAQGWKTDVARNAYSGIEEGYPSADYVVKIRVSDLPLGWRMSLSLNSRHMRNGMQNFTREASADAEIPAIALALASLVGSAIAHAETERASFGRGVGTHQLLVAGRENLSGFSQDRFVKGLEFLNIAYQLDPEYPLLLSSLGRAHAVAWRFGWESASVDSLELARNFAEQAVRLAPNDARCQADLGFVRFWCNEATESAWHYDRSLDALPFHPELAADAGMVYSYIGRSQEAASILERSVANLPGNADYRLWSLGDVFYSEHDYKNSVKWLSRMSDQSQAQRLLAASKARLGLDPTRHVKSVMIQQPDFSVRHWVAIQPFTDEEERAEFEQALLLAGLPP
jgi:adenylate cyclase